MILKEQGEKKVYSDGAETEQRMLQIAQQFPEDRSEDFIADDSTYTVNNTFSSVRRNILNWYPFKENADILEVGAGMGSITGLLCDVAASVTSIEMNDLRADVIRTRYAQRKNLTVISENINTWNTDQRFDYVVFIGVLEYAAVFSDARRPYDEFLTSVKRLLRPDGIVLFAIENRFGLKYWLGASEDHLQTPFTGISGYPDKKSPRTFSKKELEDILERVGLQNHRFYAVLPDYKFPELIFSEDCRPDPMNLKKVSFTYSRNSVLYADEKELYRDIVANDVFPFFANSFLVEASIGTLSGQHVTHVSSKGEVYKEYRVSTVIDNAGNVYKQPMHSDAVLHIQRIQENTIYLQKCGICVLPVMRDGNRLRSEYHRGQSAQQVFRQALNDNDTLTIHKLLDSLQGNLLKSSGTVDYNINNFLVEHNIAQPGVSYGRILQKAFVDMTFYNAFWEEEELLFYDQEWCFERLPLHFCLYYATKSAYTRADVDTAIMLDELMTYLGIAPEEYSTYDQAEEVIWSRVLYRQTDFYGADGYCNRYGSKLLLETKWKEFEEIERQNEIYKKQISDLIITQQYLREAEEKVALLYSENGALLKENDALKVINASELKTNARIKEELELLETENIQLKDAERQLQQELRESAKKHQLELQEIQQETAELRQTILNKEGHIQLLLDVEREYEREKHSRTYRMALVFRRISTFFLPPNSKRRFFCKLLVKGVRHPIRMIRMINPRRIKNCFAILRTEGTESASLHLQLVEEFECSGSVDTTRDKLDIAQVEQRQEQLLSLEDYSPLQFILPEKPLVSIIIPVYNQFEYTYHCLESVQKYSGDVAYEILLADDCSTDMTVDIEKLVTGIRYIRNAENLRFLRSCNHAARQAGGKYILFLNNDTQVQDNWLLPLVELLEKDTSIGMTGSKLVYPDGHLQEAGGIFWKDASAWNYGHMQNPEDPEYNYVKEADYISGAAIMIRRSLWGEIGGFDERFAPAYYEDADLAFEVRRHGYKVVYQPLSVVVHFEGVSNGTDLTAGQKKYQVANQQKFYDKWKDMLEAEHFSNGENVFLARDRSRGKRHILVVDHYVPQYDKDAGSKTTFMYLKMLVSKGYHITFLGDNFYRHEPYTTELQQMGVCVLYGSRYAENWKNWMSETMDCFDIFYLNRPHITIKYIDFIKERACGKIIYYGHDLHYLRSRREYELTGNPQKLEESNRWLEQETYIMRKTAMNYFPSIVECNAVHALDPSIPVKAITAYVYEDFKNIEYHMDKRNGILFVGGFGHDPNLDAVLWFIENVYPEVYKRTNAPFYIVGSKAPESITNLTIEGVIVKGFVSEEELEQLYHSSRISVVPLRYGAGVKGKVVEALYYGLPLVTTSVGAEGIKDIEDTVIVKDSAQDLINVISDLYNDACKLSEISKKELLLVRQNYSTDAVWSIIKEDF